MDHHAVSDWIFNIKDKLTDQEFKQGMETLAAKKKDDKNFYKMIYLAPQTFSDVCECCEDDMKYRITFNPKETIVQLDDEEAERISKTHACGGKSIDHFIDSNVFDAFLGINAVPVEYICFPVISLVKL